VLHGSAVGAAVAVVVLPVWAVAATVEVASFVLETFVITCAVVVVCALNNSVAQSAFATPGRMHLHKQIPWHP